LTELLIWPADNTAPPVPANLTAHGIGNRIDLSWSPSVDAESGLWYYSIYRNSVYCGSVNAPTTSFSDTAVQPGNTYWYTVRATDNEFNTSAPSNATSLAFISVILSPGALSLAALQTQQFTATVTGNTNTAVTWSLEPSVGTGNVSSNGLYTAPALIPSAQWVTIRATSVANPSNSGTAAAYLMPLSVTVTPATATLSATQTRQFTATVANAQNLSTAVAWSVAAGEGTINSSGLYTAPNLVHSPGPGPVTIRATSLADPSKWGTATVTLYPVTVYVDPASVTLAAYQSRQFSAYAAYDPLSAGVTRSLNPQVGVLWPSRVYTAPAAFTSPQTVRITATSVTDPTRSNTATVTLQDPAAIIDEKWQGNWRNNWSYSGTLTSDSLGLHGIGTVLYAGSVPDDQSIELRPICTGAQGTYLTAYLRYSDPTTHYGATVGQQSPGSIAIIRANGGDYYTLGSVPAAPATCSRPIRLNANGTGISLVWGSQPLIGTEDSALTSGTAGASITTADATAALAEAIIRGPDTTPPPAPAGLMAEGVANRIDLAWTASVDSESGTLGHAVFRDGVFLAWSQTPSSHSDTAVQPGSTHSYWVTAYDNVWNGSQPSSTAVVTVTSQPAVSITISPSSPMSLWQGQSQQFTATVTNASNVTANWYVDDVLQPGGPSTTWTFTAPASIMTYQIVTIKAVSVADPMRWASTTITLQPPTAVAIFLDPMTADLTVSGQQQFNGWVTGTTNVGVSWALSGPGQLLNCGTPFCTYQAPSSIPSLTSATLTATSVADQSKSRTATITLRPSPGISMTPARATMTASQSRLIRADVSGVTDTRATWTLSGPGSLQGCTQPSTTCTYRAPDTISSSQPTATITATSLVDPNKSASATVTLQKTFLEVNLGYVPIDLYQAPNNRPEPGHSGEKIWWNTKCALTDTIQACVAKMFGTGDPDNFTQQGVRGVRFQFGIGGPTYSTPFLLDRDNGQYLEIRAQWRANLRQFFADLSQFGITHVAPTVMLSADAVLNCRYGGCVPGNKVIQSNCRVEWDIPITQAITDTETIEQKVYYFVVLTSAGHGLVENSPIRISGFTGNDTWAVLNTEQDDWTVVTTNDSLDTFRIEVTGDTYAKLYEHTMTGSPVFETPCRFPVRSSACGRTTNPEPVYFVKTVPYALNATNSYPAMQLHNDAYYCANAGSTDSGLTSWGDKNPNDYKFWGWAPYLAVLDEVLGAAQANGLQIEDFDIQNELDLANFTLAGRLMWDNKHAMDGTVVSNPMDGTDVYMEIRNRMVAHGFNPRRATFSTTVYNPKLAANRTNPEANDFCPSVYGDSAMILHESELASAFAGGVIGWPSFSTAPKGLVCGGQTGQQLPEPGSMIALPSSWQQPEVTNIHAYVRNRWVDPETEEEKWANPPSLNSDFTPLMFYNGLAAYLIRQQKTADRVVFGEVFPADGSCKQRYPALDPDWAAQNFSGFSASTLKQRAANAGTVFRLWTNAGLACWGVPSGINPPYDPYR